MSRLTKNIIFAFGPRLLRTSGPRRAQFNRAKRGKKKKMTCYIKRLYVAIFWILVVSSWGPAQQPQTSSAVNGSNASFVQGVGPGYWPTIGSGLTLNLSAGTAICDDTAVAYVGGTLTLAASATNYVYLDQSNTCAPASNTTGFTDITIPVATVTTNATSIVAVTDLRTWSNGGKNVIYNAARFPGADAGAKIMAAHNALPSTGGTIDARGFAAPTTTTTLVITKPVHLLFGHYTYIYNGAGDMIDVNVPPNSGSVTLEGQGCENSFDGPNGTVLRNQSVTGHGINTNWPFSSGTLYIHDLCVESLISQANRISGFAINVDPGFTGTIPNSTQVHISRVQAFGHQMGIRISFPIKSVVESSPVNAWVDGLRIEGGTSTKVDSVYAEMGPTYRDGFVDTREVSGFEAWAATTAFGSGALVLPTNATTLHLFSASAGTSGASQPTTTCWKTGSPTGCTVTDGTTTWIETGTMPTQTVLGPGAAYVNFWKASTAYSLNSLILPFFQGGDSTTHIYKATAAGTSGATEPRLSTNLTAFSNSGNNVTLTVGALPSTVATGVVVTISGVSNCATSINGSWTVDSTSGNTFTFLQPAGANTAGCTGGTVASSGWKLTSGATVSDGTVTWTEIGTQTNALGAQPWYNAFYNCAADGPPRYSYNLNGGSSITLISPGTEGGAPLAYFHLLNQGSTTIIQPLVSPGASVAFQEGLRDVFPKGGHLIQGVFQGATAQGNGYAINVVGVSGANAVVHILGQFAVANSLFNLHDPQNQVVSNMGTSNLNGAVFTGNQFNNIIMRGTRAISSTSTNGANLTASCTMAAATTCTATLGATEPDTSYFPLCFQDSGATLTAYNGATSKTTTNFVVNAAASNSDTWRCTIVR